MGDSRQTPLGITMLLLSIMGVPQNIDHCTASASSIPPKPTRPRGSAYVLTPLLLKRINT